MKFILEINCDNDAFFGAVGDKSDAAAEVARILTPVVKMLAEGYVSFPQLRDGNGNVVGKAEIVQ